MTIPIDRKVAGVELGPGASQLVPTPPVPVGVQELATVDVVQSGTTTSGHSGVSFRDMLRWAKGLLSHADANLSAAAPAATPVSPPPAQTGAPMEAMSDTSAAAVAPEAGRDGDAATAEGATAAPIVASTSASSASSPVASSTLSTSPAEAPAASAASLAPTKPLIAILIDEHPNGSSRWRDDAAPIYIGGGRLSQYVDAVRESGAEVRLVWDDGKKPGALLAGMDGVLLPGGRDIHPELYGEAPDKDVKLNLSSLAFDKWQCSMIETAMQMGLPMRGICRGLQLINVAAKGTLVQDIGRPMETQKGKQIDHVNGTHEISIDADSAFGRQMQDATLNVQSSHHQAIGRLADGFKVVARANDDVIEAVERIGDPSVMGVQFHPERASKEVRRRFFGAFAQDATKFLAAHPGRQRPAPMALSTPRDAPPAPRYVARPETRASTYVPRSTTMVFPSGEAASPKPAVSAAEVHYKPEPSAVEIAARAAAERRVKLLDAGLQTLQKAEQALYHFNKPIASVALDENGQPEWPGSFFEVRANGQSTAALIKLDNRTLENFLLSLTEEGRQHLPPDLRDLLQTMDTAVSYLGKGATTADAFSRNASWFSTEKIHFPMGAVMAFWEKRLCLTYRDRISGESQQRSVDSMPTLRSELEIMRQCTKKIWE